MAENGDRGPPGASAMTDSDTTDRGQTQVDGEHKVQMGLMTALAEGVRQGKPQAELAAIVSQLVDYTNVHFLSEQLLMRLYSYPHFEGHQAEHDKLLEQARTIERAVLSGDMVLGSDELTKLNAWLTDHIERMDRGFHLYLDYGTAPQSPPISTVQSQ